MLPKFRAPSASPVRQPTFKNLPRLAVTPPRPLPPSFSPNPNMSTVAVAYSRNTTTSAASSSSAASAAQVAVSAAIDNVSGLRNVFGRGMNSRSDVRLSVSPVADMFF